MISSLALANTHTHHLLLRCHIFSCTCTMMGCSFMIFLALAQSWTHANLMLSYDIFSCTCIILHTHLMLRYDIFPGTESTNGFLGTIWQSDNWPTTWKKWKTVRLNCLSSSDPNTSFMKCTSEAFLYTEVKNARVRGSLLPCLRPRSGGLPQSQTYHLSLSQNKGKKC